MAGINAALKSQGKEPFLLGRSDAYIGVLIDDLITKGTDEPYRMFTSRAEYRILLRQDNADIRLTEKGKQLGLVTQERFSRLKEKIEFVDHLMKFFKKTTVSPEEINQTLEALGSSKISQKTKMNKLISRPKVEFESIEFLPSIQSFLLKNGKDKEAIDQAVIQVKYNGYISREKDNAEKIRRLEKVEIPIDFTYEKLASLSSEAKQKLTAIKPKTVAQAGRISGVSPADISVLLVYMGR